jgi:hypothetical protein
MANRSNRITFLFIVLFALVGGCALVPEPENDVDPRLDQLVSKVDQSLANQEMVNAQLQEQRQQLDLQQQHLQVLSQDLGKALEDPAEASCPKAAACPQAEEISSKMVVGGIEEVWLSELDFALAARIDTGAETSSLDARNIELFERDGKRWVRFEIMNPNTGEPVLTKRRLRRTVGIIQSGATEAKRRPVVRMAILIGHISQKAEFTLSDRSHSKYQALIGRSILKDVMVVDVSGEKIAPYVFSEESSGKAGASR